MAGKRGRKAKKNAYYVDPKIFFDSIVEYKETGCDKLYNEIGKMFILIANGMSFKPNWINYSEDIKEEAVSLGLYNMTKYINTFNPERSKNAFAWFSQISFNAFRLTIKKFKETEEVKIPISSIEDSHLLTNESFDEFEN